MHDDTTEHAAEGGEVTRYRGFKIKLLPNRTLAAYRNAEYERAGTASYAVNVEPESGYYNEELQGLIAQIDAAGDFGEMHPEIRYIIYFQDGSSVADYGSEKELAAKYPTAIQIVEA